MSNAPAFNPNKTTVTSTSESVNADSPRESVPISSMSPEERRRQIKMIRNGEIDGKIVARPRYEDDTDEAPQTRTIRAAELTADASKIGTDIKEAQAAAAQPESTSAETDNAELNDMQKELMQAKVEAIKKEMEAIEKALGDEGKSPEQIKEARKKKIGHAAWKIFEIVGGAVAGAGASAALAALTSMI